MRPSSHGRWFVTPGWADAPPRELPQHQGRDHTVYQSASVSFVLRHLLSVHRLNLMAACPANSDHARYRRVHRISSRVCDDRETPLVWDETKGVMRCFEQKGNRNIFRYGAGQHRNTNRSRRALHQRTPEGSRPRTTVCGGTISLKLRSVQPHFAIERGSRHRRDVRLLPTAATRAGSRVPACNAARRSPMA